jgi:hypothetical protein
MSWLSLQCAGIPLDTDFGAKPKNLLADAAPCVREADETVLARLRQLYPGLLEELDKPRIDEIL